MHERRAKSPRMFVDRIKVFAQAGDGGRGCVSFRREKFVPRGGPDGGDGGRGGDVILRADVHTDNLSNLFYEPIIKAKSGAHGQGKKKHGRAATRRYQVPIGTVVYKDEGGAMKAEEIQVAREADPAFRPPPSDFSPIADLTTRVKSLFSAWAEAAAERATCTSKVRATARRSNHGRRRGRTGALSF